MLRFACLALLCFAALPASAGQLTVFAAASTKTALDDIAALWHDQTGHRLVASYAGSATLARQIQRGAPADVMLSANAAWMDGLEADGLLAPGTRRDLLGNTLVLIATAPHAPLEIADLPLALNGGYLAMAHPEAVPAGIYGKAALENLGLWDALSPRVARTDNVRAALALVASGEAPFGVTYATDAKASEAVEVVYRFDPKLHPPITYPIAAIQEGNTELAQAFLNFLQSDLAKAAFITQGFEVLPE